MLDTLEASDSRSIGAEQVGLSWFRYLEMNQLFRRLGFTPRQTNLATLSILGRLINPGSELSTHSWAKELSGLGELLGEDLSHLSKNSIYHIADRIFEHKEQIKVHLRDREDPVQPITVVIDAGIATEENLGALKEANINYVAVSRRGYRVKRDGAPITIRDENGEKIVAQLIEDGEEKVLQIHSRQKERKESSIKSKFELLFLDKLDHLQAGLSQPHRLKRYDKVMEHIGRLREKYRRVSAYYDIEVIQKGDRATDIKYSLKQPERYAERFSGHYFLRTNRLDLDEKSIWNIYNLICRIEKSSESLKSDLGFRPIYHQKEPRSDAHLFISVLAYHLLNSIEQRLKLFDDNRRWSSIRRKLSNHTRITVSLGDRSNREYRVRLNVKPNPEQWKIYRQLLVKEMMLHPNLIPQ
ncbi:MAG: hypothetical protein Kow0042_15220 [Calditrichia bacterium]